MWNIVNGLCRLGLDLIDTKENLDFHELLCFGRE
jgi:hypothetical protein